MRRSAPLVRSAIATKIAEFGKFNINPWARGPACLWTPPVLSQQDAKRPFLTHADSDSRRSSQPLNSRAACQPSARASDVEDVY